MNDLIERDGMLAYRLRPLGGPGAAASGAVPWRGRQRNESGVARRPRAAGHRRRPRACAADARTGAVRVVFRSRSGRTDRGRTSSRPIRAASASRPSSKPSSRRWASRRSRTVVAGFSQGGIMSASVALTRPEAVGGFGILAGRILPELEPAIADPAALRHLRAFIATAATTPSCRWTGAPCGRLAHPTGHRPRDAAVRGRSRHPVRNAVRLLRLGRIGRRVRRRGGVGSRTVTRTRRGAGVRPTPPGPVRARVRGRGEFDAGAGYR